MTNEEEPTKGRAAGGAVRRSTSRASSKSTKKAPAGTGRKKAAAAGTATKKPARSRTPRSGAAGGGRKPKEAPPEQTAEAPKVETRPLPRLQTRFREEIAPAMVKEFGYTSLMQVPRLNKVVLNIGLGEALENPRAAESAIRDLSLISGQKPITTRARKSIAGFKVREGMLLGLSVSLRGRRMYEFFDRLVSSALPRIRDFRGVSRDAFDGRGNYSLGIREQVIFPEIDYNNIDRIRGLQVTIVTTAPTDHEGLRLLELMGVPFARVETAATAA